jgi:ATP-dependent Lon protease
MRKRNYTEFALGAHLSASDERAVRKTVSGLLKVMHPHGEWTRTGLREYLELAKWKADGE